MSGIKVTSGSFCAERPPMLSVVVPTMDERDNVEILFARLCELLGAAAWEMIVVDDDSRDGTWLWAKERASTDRRLRCLRRVNRRGLSGACVEGALSSSAPYVAVMDGDLQHDEAILVDMLALIEASEADLVIGTRRRGASPRSTMSAPRRWLSGGGAALFRRMLSRNVTDPMSGFFVMRRTLIEDLAPHIVPDGFKILADILLSAPRNLRVAEVEYVFRQRVNGESKLDLSVALDYAGLLVHHLSYDVISPRFMIYSVGGATGLLVHLVILRCLLIMSGEAFNAAESVACYGAMASNFLFNNAVTFRDRRFRGWSMIPALVFFCAVCSIGVAADLSVSTWVFDPSRWWVAGVLGALVSAVWNFAVSGKFVWSIRAGSRTRRQGTIGSAALEATPMRPGSC